jgi:HEAT repeat protein
VREVMLGLAESSRDPDVDHAILAALITEGFDEWDRLLAIARDEDRPGDIRESAIFWLGQEASAVSTAGLEEIVEDDDVELELREHAIFSLSQQGIDRCFGPLSKVALESKHPQLREQAFFWLAQHDDPRVIDLLEDVLLQ